MAFAIPSHADRRSEALGKGGPCITTAEGNDIWWGRPFGAPPLTKPQVDDFLHGDTGGDYGEWTPSGGAWHWRSWIYDVCPGAEWPGAPNKNYMSLQFRRPTGPNPGLYKLLSPSMGNSLCAAEPSDYYPTWTATPDYALGLCH